MVRAQDHPNIIQIIELFEDEERLHIVMEHCEGGDLCDNIQDFKGDEKHARDALKQICSVVQYLHDELGIAHLDLKPENILVKYKKNDYGHPKPFQLKLIDFEYAKRISGDGVVRGEKSSGTPGYIAPEVVQSGEYSKQADIWAIGMIAFAMIFNYDALGAEEIYLNALRAGKQFINETKDGYGPWFPKHQPVTGQCRNFIARCLQTKRKQRPSISELAGDSWFQYNSRLEWANAVLLHNLIHKNHLWDSPLLQPTKPQRRQRYKRRLAILQGQSSRNDRIVFPAF